VSVKGYKAKARAATAQRRNARIWTITTINSFLAIV